MDLVVMHISLHIFSMASCRFSELGDEKMPSGVLSVVDGAHEGNDRLLLYFDLRSTQVYVNKVLLEGVVSSDGA